MARTKQHRWVCPRCERAKLAPARPRKDDVRRFCLPCSETTGRLVERTCPVLDAQREKNRAAYAAKERWRRKAEQKKKQQKRQRDRERECVGGHDLRYEAHRLAELLGEHISQLNIRRRATGTSTGICYPGICRIAVTVGTDAADALATVAHEVTHLRRRGHNELFWRDLQSLMERAWPGLVWLPYPHRSLSARRRHDHLCASLRAHLRRSERVGA